MSAAAIPDSALVTCEDSIALHSKSFHLASRLLPAGCREDTEILYAWCRRADDAVDEVPTARQADELARLRCELDEVYSPRKPVEPTLAAFQSVIRRARIPRTYPGELIEGMAMDVERVAYASQEELLRYCYRVASTVGLMMCHLIGLRQEEALRQAAHLGIAMQLTNICRDVWDDWQRGRLYLPDDMLGVHGAGGLRRHLGAPFPETYSDAVARTVQDLLALAETYYRSADQGLIALPWRSALGVRAARSIYSDIGREIERQDCDIQRGRAVVSKARKLILVALAFARSIGEAPRRTFLALTSHREFNIPSSTLEFSNDLLQR